MAPSAALATIAAPPTLDELCINTLRFLAVDMVQKANSGHPGLPMGSAAMAYALWDRSLKFNPRDPHWPDRDRFILSAGHGCALLYALLHVTGFDLPLEELKMFRQWGSRTPGHPEYGKTPGVEATTGPSGPGPRERSGHGHCRSCAGGAIQSAWAPDRGPLHVRACQRWRS